jgi:hypothetical protein
MASVTGTTEFQRKGPKTQRNFIGPIVLVVVLVLAIEIGKIEDED